MNSSTLLSQFQTLLLLLFIVAQTFELLTTMSDNSGEVMWGSCLEWRELRRSWKIRSCQKWLISWAQDSLIWQTELGPSSCCSTAPELPCVTGGQMSLRGKLPWLTLFPFCWFFKRLSVFMGEGNGQVHLSLWAFCLCLPSHSSIANNTIFSIVAGF